MSYESKESLLARGKDLATRFCELNGIVAPVVVEVPGDEWRFSVCAYYRANTTTICLKKCAGIGYAGQQWSCPGYTVDRTPYGVVQHELGHHVDVLMSVRTGAYYGDFSQDMRKRADEEPITTYCPNDGEWFAEMFRVFVTNPALLQALRPRTHADLLERFKPVFHDTWQERLAEAPDRTMTAAKRKVEAAAAARQRLLKAS